MTYEFDAAVWVWEARRTETWTFVTLPAEASDEIADVADRYARGFGSLRVDVTIGGTSWRTSIFPDGGRGGYVLPVKKAVRKAEGLDIGDTAHVRVTLVDV
ncbi:DUF1905 domain-containing protein [Cellulomonas chengniuliangii]|uniref:DUF1905 domain-containing protein n=1 Tax=Cellulomonas chengniuliangii TaxID=2968084 RepID=A0ABY5L4G9_9CELL|nr:DUF1905 domain-containing protein [Cellulomonas chengniuliangii]MCC2308361.1 DUF1905 domain-containing protein [Cellulomonas chengniuliangii]MCC2317378.1 DUF1905 domain-containing protein [Cellulomonas chengniuliangii]UUI76743.1 DUF1905 domain-containing protein [Cellulomonas chengniuliangii]